MIKNSYTATGSGFGRSVMGILLGLLMFLGSDYLLFWNEGRAVTRSKSLDEGQALVVRTSSAEIDPKLQGRLVHVSGKVAVSAKVVDPEFTVAASALQLNREVEMFQWVETEETNNTRANRDSEQRENTYSYSREWRAEWQDSSDFAENENHQNPPMRWRSEQWPNQTAKLGAYRFSETDIGALDGMQKLTTPVSALPQQLAAGFRQSGRWLVMAKSVEESSVGDIRIRFSILPEMNASVVAKLEGEAFAPFTTRFDDSIYLLQTGLHTAEQMFASAHSENTVLTWMLRVLGFALLLIAFVLILKPINVLASVIPFVGRLVGMATGLVSFLLAVIVWLAVVAVAWIFYRPVLGLAMLAVVAGIAWITKKQVLPPPLPTAARSRTPPPPPPPPSS